MTFPDFAFPWLLLLLLPAAAVLLAAYRKKQPSIKFPDIKPAVNCGKIFRGFRWKRMISFGLYALSMILVIIALARPREGLEEIRRRTDGVDIIIALDVSGSMASIDIPEGTSTKSQLEQATFHSRCWVLDDAYHRDRA